MYLWIKSTSQIHYLWIKSTSQIVVFQLKQERNYVPRGDSVKKVNCIPFWKVWPYFLIWSYLISSYWISYGLMSSDIFRSNLTISDIIWSHFILFDLCDLILYYVISCYLLKVKYLNQLLKIKYLNQILKVKHLKQVPIVKYLTLYIF